MKRLVLLLGLVACSGGERRAAPRLDEVDVKEHLGAQLPLDAPFMDHEGRAVSLRGLAGGTKPFVLAIAYYRCPMLCGMVLGGIARTLNGLESAAGRDLPVVTISFDPSEGPEEARHRRSSVLGTVERGGKATAAWQFWTGPKTSTEVLLGTLGVTVQHDPATKQWAHPAVWFVVTPDGRISRYLYGVDVRPFDVRLALAEAAKGETGSTFDKVLLRCFRYDPTSRRYAPVISGIMRAGGGAILLVVLLGLGFLFRMERRLRAEEGR